MIDPRQDLDHELEGQPELIKVYVRINIIIEVLKTNLEVDVGQRLGH
jgi:hypothetical protein